MAVPASALVSGDRWPKFNRKWIAVVVLIVASLVSYKMIRHLQKAHARRALAMKVDTELGGKISTMLERSGSQEGRLFSHGTSTYITRASNGGKWLSTLFWPPSVAGRSRRILGLIINLLGWVLILLLALHMLASVRRREWTWVGLLLFCASLVLIQGRPVPRYLAPVGPLLFLGIWQGMGLGSSRESSTGIRKLARIAGVGLMVSICVCNLSILAVNAWVARSGNFLDICLAGEYRDILRVGDYLQREADGQDKVGVYVEYRDLARTKRSRWAERILVLLTDRDIVSPVRKATELSDGELLSWAKARKLRYVVTRPSNVSARLWHLKTPFFRGDSAAQDPPYYVVLEVGEDRMQAVELPQVRQGLRRVPGL